MVHGSITSEGAILGGKSENGFVIPDHMDSSSPKKEKKRKEKKREHKIRKRIILL